MKNGKKPIIPIISLLVLCALITACMGACRKDGEPFNYSFNAMFDSGFFTCRYNDDKTGVIVLNLTEEGKEQDIIIIPEKINGLPVVQLGGTTMGYPYQNSHSLESEKVKKVYIKASSKQLTGGKTNFNSSRGVDFIVISSPSERPDYLGLFSEGGYVDGAFVHNHFYGNVEQVTPLSERSDAKIEKANVVFYVGADETYWLDEIKEEGVYSTPVSPVKEGFCFAGWYLDKDHTQKWNEQFVLPEGQDMLELYAQWTENADK